MDKVTLVNRHQASTCLMCALASGPTPLQAPTLPALETLNPIQSRAGIEELPEPNKLWTHGLTGWL